MNTKSDRAKIIAASLSSATSCRLGGCGMTRRINAIGYALHSSRAHNAVIRVYDAVGSVIETHEHNGKFKEW